MDVMAEPVRRIATWIESGDTVALTRMPGIGKRGAEMVVATLKGKMEDLALPVEGDSKQESIKLSEAQRDALEVLVAWGDPRGEAERWLSRAAQLHPALDSADEWVRSA